jgi:mannitol/fructose-specific phosphotransferase system IIA component (Ntr-type)
LDELVEKNISLKSQVNEKEKEFKTMSSSSLSAKQITDVPYATIISSMIKRASTPIK